MLPIFVGAQSVQTSSLLRWLLLIMGIWRDHSCPFWRLFYKACKISQAPSPFRAASHAATCISHPSAAVSSVLESPGLCSAAGFLHGPLILGPHYYTATTAKADTDDYITEQLSLDCQDQVQVG